MKTLLPIILTFCMYGAFAQNGQFQERDVFTVKNLTFYGYDYSLFKFYDDEQRISPDIKEHSFAWVGRMIKEIPEEVMEKWLKKEKIVYNFDVTINKTKELISENLISTSAHKIPKDTLQSILSNYDLAEKEGTGLVVILECFNRSMKAVTAYYLFFDIKTQKIIRSYYISSSDGNQYNHVGDWGMAQFINFRSGFAPAYKKDLRKFK